MSSSKELAPTKQPTIAGGQVFVERLEDPVPGQYWRAKEDIDGRYDARGKYGDIPKGTVLMLREIETADGMAHVIVLASHPLWGEDDEGQKFHVDDFDKLWERALDGEVVRARELGELLNDMRLTQEAMSRPDPEAAIAGHLGYQPSLNQGGETGKELATKGGLAAMTEHVDRIQSATLKQLARIQEHSEKLSDQASSMARYHQEKATALIAAANSQQGMLGALMNKVKNLKFYAGDGVDVTLLVKGVPALAEAPITIFQDLLSFDEELLLRLDQGGLDHRDSEEVAKALCDEALLNQMIPAERGLVLVRYRGNYKEFIEGKDSDDDARAAAIAHHNELMSKESMRHRLLYRDGTTVYLIECDEVLPRISQLLPSASEQMSHFHRERYDFKAARTLYDEITTDDLDYARAQRMQLANLTDFARVLIILWGLHDRLNFFGTSNIPTFSNWLAEGFQKTFLRLVSHDSLIGVERPSFGSYRDAANRFLASGVVVAIDAHQAITSHTAPGCYSYSDRTSTSDQIYYPIVRYQLCRVQFAKGRPYVTIRVKSRKREMDARVELNKGSWHYLVIDRALPADISYYLRSRKERYRYRDYVSLFKLALEHVSDRAARELSWSEWIEDELAAAQLIADDDATRRAILTGLSAIRSGTTDGTLPLTPSDATKSMRESALNAVYAQLRNNDGYVDAVEAWCKGHGYAPVALVHSSKSQWPWMLYREATIEESDPRFAVYPWVVSQPLSFSAAGEIKASSSTSFVHYALKPDELSVKEWDCAKKWSETRCPNGYTRTRALAILDSVADQSKALDDILALVPKLLQALISYDANIKARGVHRLHVQFPIGTVIERGDPRVLAIAVDAAHFCATWGTKEERQKVFTWIERRYAHPEMHLPDLEKPCALTLATISLDAAKSSDWPWLSVRGRYVGSFESLKRDMALPKQAPKDRAPQYRLTTLTPNGARLIPEMIPYCERPTT